jgi:hypothetical protein
MTSPWLWGIWLLFPALVAGCSVDAGQQSHTQGVELESFNGGFFSVDKPKGWEIITAGSCATFAFLAHDPSMPLRQTFYFGEVGPVYLSEQQRQIDYQYVSMGGYPSNWIDMPAVNPLTPGNFLAQFHLIAKSRIGQGFMPQCPRLENLQVVSAVKQPSPINGASTELVRALFTQGGELGEGLFLVTVAPLLPFTGSPGGGLGSGFCLVGITARQTEFRALEGVLIKSVQSFTISQSYVNNCLAQQASTYAGILKAGKTLSEASDIIMQGWENRNRTDDILSEKRSDATLGKERLYDPNSGEVYEFENGFYDQYLSQQEKYQMNNLQPLPEDSHALWTKPPLDGYKYLK